MDRGYIARSKTVEWATPIDLFKKLDEEFHFTLDPCSTHENAKCEKQYTVDYFLTITANSYGGSIIMKVREAFDEM